MTLLGVVGWPVAQSKSPAMQGAALRALGLDWTYLAFAVPPERLAATVAGAADQGLRGLNVTIPHKAAALALCEPDDLSRAVGAVNTLSFEGGRILGANTDVHGFRKLLEESDVPSGGRVLLLGDGGACRAVIAALDAAGFRDLHLVSRKGAPLTVAGVTVPASPWDPAALARELAAASLVVDTTPRGLDANATPIDLAPLPANAIVIDLVVRKSTALTDAARARGLRAATGTAMLLHQGAASLERWTGKKAPIDVMRAALEAALDF